MTGERPLNVLVISQYFRPESVSIPVTLADELARRGHRVRVITAYPNYPEGRLHSGYRQRWRHEERQGKLRVRRVPIVVSHSRNPLARMANYLSYGLSSIGASRFASGADVAYVYATQMTAALGPQVWSLIRGTPYVLHVQDLWPESITGSGMVGSSTAGRTIAAALRPWLGAAYRRAAAIIAIAPGMAGILAARGARPGTVHTVFNWTGNEDAALATTHEAAPGLRITFAGNLGEHQSLETVIEAAALVDDLDLTVSIVGTGTRERSLHALAERVGAFRVRFEGSVPRDEVHAVYAASDFQLVTLADLPIFRSTIPSKLQASLAHGVPVITTVAGDVGAIVETEGIGLASPPADAEQLAATFRRAAAMTNEERIAMGVRARRYYSDQMSYDRGVSQIEKILRSVARPREERA